MDNQRIILWAIFGSLAFVTWTTWQAEHQPPPGTELPRNAAVSDGEVILATDIDLPVVAASADDPTAQLPSVALQTDQTGSQNEKPPAVVWVTTDFLNVEISTLGGTLINASLPQYPIHKDNPDLTVQLLSNTPGQEYLIASGLVDNKRNGPTHLTLLNSTASVYTLADGRDELLVPLTWTDGAGLTVEKIYHFKRSRYDIDVEYRITNNSDQAWRGLNYLQIQKDYVPIERSMFNVDTYSFSGPVVYDGEKYEKIDPDDMADEPIDLTVKGGWIAAIEHHFLTAAVPAADDVFSYEGKFVGKKITLRGTGPALTIAPGETRTISSTIFIGPKLQSQLNEVAPGLALTVDYGLLAIVAQPLFKLLEFVHNIIGNWGWSIILVTFLIKAVFYKLTEASGRSMAKMRNLQPRLKALQERYKDDRQALSTAMMDLYKREKVNPAAGCLPMLIQIPFFIAFYWVLLESVEMRQAPFMLWITDLSSRDPYFILPLLMGAAMFVQQKLNPAPPDPMQAKIMSILPIMFTGFFAFFPSGLVLYWLTNSVLSVLQQWNINRKMNAGN
ncbi:MAG: membrane protein insertase YidC [Gammaproteobacteria bacterium]|nr:membrane protein insertase YidC [Gammaproteobacteria bacterium]MCP4090888.1 membrane protein insertase YidC [Gammaproteobacteria bacterium]MCP4275175.1 membrane protein insertase YidC [Gammaproteobacteria bacterium]MCP4830815.1 membrane protein insertase YidC [Gammaproteobacteria bacterium]MCP4929604.1 membrane protein insertase YidC [Gammaproteobacteria bacterium]